MSKMLGGHVTIKSYVQTKLQRLSQEDPSFTTLFELMFSEKENIMFESNNGYRISQVTYGECYTSILGKAAALRAGLAGVPHNAVIGLCMENSRAWIEAFWAILLSGYCPLLLNLRLNHETLEKTLQNTNAQAVVSAEPVDFSVKTILFSELSAEGTANLNESCGTAILLMSSGTSEHVKICAYDAGAFRVMIEDSYQIIKKCPQIKKFYKNKLKLLAFLPFYHIFGLVAVYIWFSFFARTFVLLEDMSPKTILGTIRRHEVTHIFAVPMLWNTVYEQAMRTIRSRGPETLARFEKGMAIQKKVRGVPVLRGLVSKILFREVRQALFGDSIRFLICGGSEVKPEVLTFFNAIGYYIANGYGMTELGITSVELSPNPAVRDQASVGQPLSSVEYRLDGQGLLLVRSAGMARAIFDGVTWTKHGDDWFHTGDLARECNGTWFILGRSDDLVISPTGENLNPTLIEAGLSVKGIRDLCLIGVHGEKGVVPTVLATPKFPLPAGGLRKLYDSLLDSIRQNGLEKQIQSVVFVQEPLLSGGDIKLNRVKIARRFREGSFTVLQPDCDGGAGASELKVHIRALFAEATGKSASQITDQSDFFTELGGNSLDYFSMVLKMQEEYGVSFPLEDGKTLTTVNALADYVTQTVDANG